MKNHPPNYCQYCHASVSDSDLHTHWGWNRNSSIRAGGRWYCKIQDRKRVKKYRQIRRDDPVRFKLYKDREHAYCNRNKLRRNYHSLKRKDDKRGYGVNDRGYMTERHYLIMCKGDCIYCGRSPANGVDRLDSDFGHDLDNYVPCCSVCNCILSDLSREAKMCLRTGLTQARQKGYTDGWKPPFMRRKEKV